MTRNKQKTECPACGKEIADPRELLTCPTCHREGCCTDDGQGCMPAGARCSCPECEEEEEFDDD